MFGISMKLVMPPATAARDSVYRSALYSRPGSRKCTWSSIMPGITTRPFASNTRSPGCAAISASIFSMRPLRMRRSPWRRVSSTSSALRMSQSVTGSFRIRVAAGVATAGAGM